MSNEDRKLLWLYADELLVDPRYQRRLKSRILRIIMEEFDSDKIGVLLVSERAPNKRYLLDGQHRVEAFKRMGYGRQKLPALVYYDITPQREAELFDGANTHAVTSPLEKFKARLFAKEEAAVALEDAVRKGGFHIDTMADAQNNGLVCVSALQDIAGEGTLGLPYLVQVLSLLRDTWEYDRTSKRGELITGLSTYLTWWGNDANYTRKRFVDKLSKIPASKILRDTASFREAVGGSPRHVVARVLAMKYNQNLRQSAQLTPYEELSAKFAKREAERLNAVNPSVAKGYENRRKLRDAMISCNNGAWHKRPDIQAIAGLSRGSINIDGVQPQEHLGLTVEQKKENKVIWWRLVEVGPLPKELEKLEKKGEAKNE